MRRAVGSESAAMMDLSGVVGGFIARWRMRCGVVQVEVRLMTIL